LRIIRKRDQDKSQKETINDTHLKTFLWKKISATKYWLNSKAVGAMTLEQLSERDPDDDIRSWFRKINELLE
jgi:hypothetical protein